MNPTLSPTPLVNRAPFFAETLLQKVSLYTNETYTYKLPSIRDPDGDIVHMSVKSQPDYLPIPDFITYT
jgi:hypothetical protein